MTKQPKVIELLKSFDIEDWRECDDFLQGQLRAGHDCHKLFLYIKKNRKKSSHNYPPKQVIKSTLFPHITDKSFTNVLSKLYLMIEDYLVFREITSDRTEYKLTLLKALSGRGLFQQFNIIATQLEKEIIRNHKLDLFDEIDLLKLNHLRFFSDNPVKNERGDILLQELAISNKEFYNQYSTFLKAVHIHLEDLSVKYKKGRTLTAKKTDLSDFISLFYEFKKDRDPDNFKMLQHMVISEDSKLSESIKLMILEILIHDAHKQIKKGNFSLADELLNLYEYGLESGMMLSNKKITENRFVNIVSTACGCQKFDRAELFINKYKELLDSSTKEGSILISKAHITFARGQYGHTIELLRDFYFNSLGQNIRRRWMLLCAYYKVYGEELDFIDHQLKNYNSFFYNNRKKLSDSVYHGSLNLGKVIGAMVNDKRNKEIMALVDSLDQLVFRSWILKETGTL